MTALYAGVDLGGTGIKVALCTECGEVVAESQAPTESERGPEAVVETMAGLVAEAAAGQGQLRGVGVGCPGLVDRAAGVTRFLPNLPGQWRDVPVGRMLGDRLGAPVFLLNDARLATLGELHFGWGRGRERTTFVLLTLGTGVGGGVVVDGRIRLGQLGAAGELGHLPIVPLGQQCSCGSRGCLETVASGSAMVGEALRWMRAGQATALEAEVDGHLDRLTPELIGAYARDGDRAAAAVVRRAGEAIGLAASSLVLTLHPDAIVLGGGVSAIGEPLTDSIAGELRSRVSMFPIDDIEVVVSELGAQGGALGGAALARCAGEL
ncbi:MAG TPA: ROK family protein [Thermoanaerobaculia bacterium]|nr:ROK family protein [Thermoanaerobaculia bacterium]